MTTFCPACGNSMNAEDQFCRVCGRQATADAGAAAAHAAPVPPVGPAETSTKAVVSLICGLLFFIPLAFVAAIIFGHLSLSEIRKSAGRLKGEGIAIAGLILGYVWIAGIPIILIIAAIAIPNVLRARIVANESSAVACVRTLNTAEVAYSTAHNDTGYTCALSDLTQFIDPKLASGQKNGYTFALTDCSAEAGAAVKTKYKVVAYPTTTNQTGMRAFCSDESTVIKVDSGGSTQSCLENGTVLQ